jgi:hypothetical protein
MSKERELRIRAYAQGRWKMGPLEAVQYLLTELDAERKVAARIVNAAPMLLVHNSTCNICIQHDITRDCTCGVDDMKDALQAYDHRPGRVRPHMGRTD